MSRLMLLCAVCVVVVAPQPESRAAETKFLEISIAKETRKGVVEEVVLYVKSEDLKEAGVSEEELRQCFLWIFKAMDEILYEVIKDILPDEEDSSNGSSPDEPKKIVKEPPFDKAKFQPLFDRGIFMETRSTSGGKTTVLRGVFRSDSKNQAAKPKEK